MPIDLSVDICGLTFKNPIIVASGTRTSSSKHILKCFEHGAAGAVTKTITYDVMHQIQPKPRMHVVNPEDALRGKFYSFYSIELMSEYGPEKWVEEIRKIKRGSRRHGGILIASIAGRTFEEWEKLARLVGEAGADMIEVNSSCPHVGERGALMGRGAAYNQQILSQIIRTVKNASSVPVIGKITLHGANPVELARTMFSSGADAVVSTARFQGLIIDVDSMRPILWGGFGGYGGPWQLPISLGWTAHIVKENLKPVIGSGGVAKWEDIVSFLLVGASAVQTCTAVIIEGYSVLEKMLRGVMKWMESKGFQRVSEFTGITLKKIIPLERLERRRVFRVVVDLNKCTGCGRCVQLCPYEAISLDEKNKAVVSSECDNCGLCVSICPFKALTLKPFGEH